MKQTYTCYSLPLYCYLKGQGNDEIKTFPNPTQSNKLVWIFNKTLELESALQEWTKGSKY